MALGEKLLLAFLGLLLLVGLLRLFAAPLKLALRLLGNTLAGFAALFVLNLTAPLTGFALGLNLMNALTVGLLGLPGLVLLILLQWLFV